MKPALLTLSFLLLFAFPLTFADQVLDIDGNPVLPGSEYYISEAILGPRYHPGVTLGKTGNPMCPVTVEVNSDIPDIAGIPVKFSIPNGAGTNGIVEGILEGTPVEIAFTSMPNCAESPVWTLLGNETQNAYVGIRAAGQPNGLGSFRILKSSPWYTLSYCLPFFVEASPLCWNIGGYYVGNPISLLVPTKNEATFIFGLIKADSNSGIRTVV